MTIFLLYAVSPVIISAITSFFCNRTDSNEKNYRKITLVICGLVMALMIGLRKYTNGSGDSEVYYNHWSSVSQIGLENIWSAVASSNFEVGYSISVFLFSHLFPHPQFLFILSGIFMSVSVCLFVSKNCKNIPLALLAYNTLELFIFMVQGLRQAIAMCICLFAIEQCKKNHFIRFLLLILLAMSFHASAIVFLICYIFKFLKLKFTHVTLFIVSCIAIVAFIPYLWNFVNFFIRDNYDMVNDVEAATGFIPIIIFGVVLLFAFIFRPTSSTNKEYVQKYSLFFYMTAFAMLLLSLRFRTASIVERICYYFAFGEIVMISNLTENIKDSDTKMAVKFAVVILCFGVILHKAGYSSLVPYNFFWQ